MKLEFELINEFSNIASFDCGVVELNFYLAELALLYQRRRFGVTSTFFLQDDPEKKIIGYYTLCPASIQRDELPKKLLQGPRPNPIPAFRLCRLAVDQKYSGKGIGKIIFIHALKKCLDQADQIGGSVIIIDAKDEKAKKFYEHFGFVSLSEKPLLLFQTIKFIQAHF